MLGEAKDQRVGVLAARRRSDRAKKMRGLIEGPGEEDGADRVVDGQHVDHRASEARGRRADTGDDGEGRRDVAHRTWLELDAATKDAAGREQEGALYLGLEAAVPARVEMTVIAERDERVLVQIERRGDPLDKAPGLMRRLGVLGRRGAVEVAFFVDVLDVNEGDLARRRLEIDRRERQRPGRGGARSDRRRSELGR